MVSQNQISFAQYEPGHLRKNTTKPESGKLVAGQEAVPTILAQLPASKPDAYCHQDQIQASFGQYDLGFLWYRTECRIGHI